MRPIVAVLVVATGFLAACAGPGAPRPGAPAHHLERGFRNLNPGYAHPGFWVRWAFFFRRAWTTTFRPPTARLPRVEIDGHLLRANPGEPTVTWVGHSTLLVQLDGVNLLTDPQWSDRASPLSFAGPRRVTPPGLRLEDLPPIALVLISHDHYDHLDVATVKRLWATHRPRFVVPLGLKAWLAGLGVTDVVELDWWEAVTEHGLSLTCLPAQHWSARTWWDQNRRLWSGWAIAGRGKRLYFAGDTGYWAPLFTEIARRAGPFDLAAVPIGAYEPPAMMGMSHTTPEEALRILVDVGAARLVAIHWGTFDLADEPIEEPAERLAVDAARRGLPPDRVWIPRAGETRSW